MFDLFFPRLNCLLLLFESVVTCEKCRTEMFVVSAAPEVGTFSMANELVSTCVVHLTRDPIIFTLLYVRTIYRRGTDVKE